jgi:hypothetical protein
MPGPELFEKIDARGEASSGVEVFEETGSKVIGDIVGYLNG